MTQAPSQDTHSPVAATPWRTVGVLSRGLARVPHLAALLGAERVIERPSGAQARHLDAVVGWGEKANTQAARRYARRHGVPYCRAEDGFLRSVGVGATGDPPLAMVIDDRGIYYDARQPSRLEELLESSDDPSNPDLLARARRAIDRITEAGLSKYNDSPPEPLDLGPREGSRVLVVDQTFGDLSVRCGLASEDSFRVMLRAALDENPGAEILVKTHPDVLCGAKRGYLGDAAGDPRVRVIGEAANPIFLAREVDRVYVVTSQLGFEALLVGTPVVCFGVPFYAGWGLTDDRAEVPRRSRPRSLEEVFAAAYLLYSRYLDPDTGRAGTLEDVIEHLALQRQQFARNQGRIFCFGFRFWKQGYVRDYLRCPGNRVVFPRSAAHARRLGFGRGDQVLVWGQRGGEDARRLADSVGAAVWRMEDGFLRSVGLGSDLATPASLVVDGQGIYYDPTGPSELETILETAELSAEEVERAAALRREIVSAGLSKYNVGESHRLTTPRGARVLLVPGQVEDDASIRLGCRDVRTNKGLLVAARRAAPDAYLIFKPHPDVLSGNRVGAVAAAELRSLCDHVEEAASLSDCLAVADEVHTLTSLVGFDALLRGIDVVVYGQPFYAGWGLTRDHHPVMRRTRRLELDELVAAALIRYPRYLCRRTGRFTTPEAVIAELREERDASPAARALKLSWSRRQLRKLVHAYRGVTHAP